MAKKTRGASAASSKKQTKAAQRELKKKQRENKKKLEQQTRAASKLRRVIKTYDENSHKSDRDYIVEMLDANPAWVAKLAMVIRQGGMKILIDLETKGEKDSDALDYGPRWKGKNVRTFLKLPMDALQAMILATLPKGTKTPDMTDEWWVAAFQFQFHVTEDTLLPKHDLLRCIMVVEEFARLRVAEIGNRIENILGEGQLDKLTNRDFAIFQLEAHQPAEAASASKQHSAVLKCSVLGEAQDLPALKPNQGPWKMDDGNSPDAMITAKDCPLQFRASDYFPKLPATGNRWTYHVDADALARKTSSHD